jgi:sugar phosphate permease
MKALISILLFISVVISGVTSFNLFYQFDYNTSAILTIASYLSIVFCIFALTMGKNRPQVGTSSELLRHAPPRS